MSAIVKALSHDFDNSMPDPDLDVDKIFKTPEPEKRLIDGHLFPFLKKHKKSIFKMFVVFLYYLIGCIYYKRNMDWDVLDTVYFITVSSTIHAMSSCTT